MEVPQKLKDLAVSESGFVFDPHSGATFSVNASALVVLQALKQGCGRASIADQLREAFDLTEGDIERDLDEFMHLLRRNSLVPNEFEVEP
jgi:PqqD family protein of HPr-rel-A system